MMQPEPLLEAALRYVAMGYAVLPCRPGRKEPLPPRGLLDATRDPEALRGWWSRWPAANVALSCAGLVVVDLDPARPPDWPGSERREALRALDPPIQKTPRGWHIFFRRPAGAHWRCSAGRLAPGVDIRTTGGYVLVAPSHVNGRPYVWRRPLPPLAELPEPPAWLRAALDSLAAGTAAQRATDTGRGARDTRPTATDSLALLPEGERNSGLFRLACRWRRAGLGGAELRAALLAANAERCRPPLEEREVIRIADSAARYPAGPGCPELPWALREAWRHAIEHRRKEILKKRGRKHG